MMQWVTCVDLQTISNNAQSAAFGDVSEFQTELESGTQWQNENYVQANQLSHIKRDPNGLEPESVPR